LFCDGDLSDRKVKVYEVFAARARVIEHIEHIARIRIQCPERALSESSRPP
jgi:hypothetical protein